MKEYKGVKVLAASRENESRVYAGDCQSGQTTQPQYCKICHKFG